MLIKLKASQKVKIISPKDVHKTLIRYLKSKHRFDQEKEHFWTIGLTAAHTIVYIDTVGIGTITGVIAETREIFRFAILKGVVKIVISHNHPSGNLNPSEADIEVTNKLIKSGKILGIEIMDHLIITTKGYYSFKDEGKM
jgi:DNA repair protein RadC